MWDPLHEADPAKPRAAPDATTGRVSRKGSRLLLQHHQAGGPGGRRLLLAHGQQGGAGAEGGLQLGEGGAAWYDGGRRRYGAV